MESWLVDFSFEFASIFGENRIDRHLMSVLCANDLGRLSSARYDHEVRLEYLQPDLGGVIHIETVRITQQKDYCISHKQLVICQLVSLNSDEHCAYH